MSKSPLRSCGGIFDWDTIEERLAELNHRSEDPELWNDPARAQKVMRDRQMLEKQVTGFRDLEQQQKQGRDRVRAAEKKKKKNSSQAQEARQQRNKTREQLRAAKQEMKQVQKQAKAQKRAQEHPRVHEPGTGIGQPGMGSGQRGLFGQRMILVFHP